LSHSNRDIHRKLTISPADILTCEASRLPPCWRVGMVVSPSTQSHISSTSQGCTTHPLGHLSPPTCSACHGLFHLAFSVACFMWSCSKSCIQATPCSICDWFYVTLYL
jgi:hypothetical protein